MPALPCDRGRRDTLKLLALGAGAALLSPSLLWAQAPATPILRPIPSSGQRLPIVGLGTNAYGVDSAEARAPLREVLARLAQVPGSIVDTAPAYRNSEAVLGELIAELGVRDQLFLATKVTAPGNDLEQAKAQLENSFRLLRTDTIDLMQVHNLQGADAVLPLLADMKRAGRIRHIGITTSNTEAHAEAARLIREHALDFVQVNYSVDNRNAEREVFPAALERRTAVLLNVPLGGRRGSLFGKVKDVPLPAWAAEFDAASWGQLFLKYSLAHPAVTAVIPGTTKVANLEDNLGAGRGRLPDAAQRTRIEALWDGLG